MVFHYGSLLTGSIAPDFLYFIKMNGNEDFGHSLAGIFLFDLPISYLLAITFHAWVRNLFLKHLPCTRKKYAGYQSFDFEYYLKQKWLIFFISAFLGAVSHIGWDKFCTPDGLIFYLTPSFFNQPFLLAGELFPLYTLIEYAGSALGLGFLVLLAVRANKPALQRPGSPKRAKWVFWLSLLIITLCFTGLKFAFDPGISQMSHIILIITSAACYAVGFVSALYTWLSVPSANR